ncbi:MAG: class I SAM-dependent methyltransferase [Nanoarchaeota archaeon]|nr:class I SAM-dependent methyltransferase [Nanoarchaeota archaeon]
MKCPLCFENNVHFFDIYTQEADKKKCRALKCKKCGLVYLEDYKKDRSKIYGENYAAWSKSEEATEQLVAKAKKEAFSYQLGLLTKFFDPKNKNLLDIGTGKGYLLDVAAKKGFDCYGLDISKYAAKHAEKKFPGKIFIGSLSKAGYKQKFDVITITAVIEHISDPLSFLSDINKALKPGGYLLVMTPNTNSLIKKVMGKNWFQYKYEHITYWNKKSLKFLLGKYDFKMLVCKNNIKRFNLTYYSLYFQRYSLFGMEKIFLFIYKLLPEFIKKSYFTNPLTSEILVVARKNK